MGFTIRKAVRSNVSVIISVAGGTGSGKTKSGFELATGLSAGKPFCVIDTENGRARHYAPKEGEAADNVNTYAFDVIDLTAPFSPSRYTEAIKVADKADYPVIMVDSMSHEHAGDGGLLDMHEAELDRMAGQDWAKRERVKMSAWIKPKSEHKDMMQALLMANAHIILCFRAEEKIEIAKVDGQWKAVPKKTRTGRDGWVPVCEKSIPFEATCSFLLTDDAPGMPKPIKLQGQHRAIFPLDKAISQESGRAMLAWAAGAGTPASKGTSAPQATAPVSSPEPQSATGAEPAGAAVYISVDQCIDLREKMKEAGLKEADFVAAAGVEKLSLLPAKNSKGADNYKNALKWIERERGGA